MKIIVQTEKRDECMAINGISSASAGSSSQDTLAAINSLKQQKMAIEKQIAELEAQKSNGTANDKMLKNLEKQKAAIEKQIAQLQSAAGTASTSVSKDETAAKTPQQQDEELNARFGPAYTTELSPQAMDSLTKKEQDQDTDKEENRIDGML